MANDLLPAKPSTSSQGPSAPDRQRKMAMRLPAFGRIDG
jgi:hypothetical protein